MDEESGAKVIQLENTDDDANIVLPNVTELINTILNVLSYMNSVYMKNIKKNNNVIYEHEIEIKFPEFVENYYTIFKFLQSGNDINMLLQMILSINNIKNGEVEYDTVIEQLRDELAEIYLPHLTNK
jgi:hypothetical protein